MSSDMSIAVGVDGEEERKAARQAGRGTTSATWAEARGETNRSEKGGMAEEPENTRAQGSRVAVYKQRNAEMYIQTAADRNQAGE